MADRGTTVIGPGTAVNGRVEGTEDLQVLGVLRGSLRLEGALFVEAEARVEADAEVTTAIIHGIYVGNVTATDRVELTASARVLGDLTAPRIILQDGAAYSGLIDMGDVDSAEAPARRPAAPARAAPTTQRPGAAPARPASVPARPAAPPARPAPPPARPAAPPPRAAPTPPPAEEQPPEEPEAADDAGADEPELPEGAAPKKVNVKKKK